MDGFLEYLEAHGHEYDLIHASPPCQGYSHLTPAKNKGDHEKLIPAVRALMQNLGKPYVIENVAGARHELENPVMLCGSMFWLRTQRHRYFETNIPGIFIAGELGGMGLMRKASEQGRQSIKSIARQPR